MKDLDVYAGKKYLLEMDVEVSVAIMTSIRSYIIC